jgi:hypothetical protein
MLLLAARCGLRGVLAGSGGVCDVCEECVRCGVCGDFNCDCSCCFCLRLVIRLSKTELFTLTIPPLLPTSMVPLPLLGLLPPLDRPRLCAITGGNTSACSGRVTLLALVFVSVRGIDNLQRSDHKLQGHVSTGTHTGTLITNAVEPAKSGAFTPEIAIIRFKGFWFWPHIFVQRMVDDAGANRSSSGERNRFRGLAASLARP